jgi:hypothetical protein
MLKREMILTNSAGGLVLGGAELHEGEKLEIKIATPGGARWFVATVARYHERWILKLRNRVALVAAGQLARRPPVPPTPEMLELLRRLRYCHFRCPRRGQAEGCAGCSLPSRKSKLAQDETMPAAIRRLCE